MQESGGWAKWRQAAGWKPFTHTHLTKSHRSPFSCRQKKNRGDGQAEQNEVKVILFKRGDRYSHDVCMCTCVRVWAFYRTSQSAGKWSCSDMTAGQVSLSSGICVRLRICERMCVLVYVDVYVCMSLEVQLQVWGHVKVKSWKVQVSRKMSRTNRKKGKIITLNK